MKWLYFLFRFQLFVIVQILLSWMYTILEHDNLLWFCCLLLSYYQADRMFSNFCVVMIKSAWYIQKCTVFLLSLKFNHSFIKTDELYFDSDLFDYCRTVFFHKHTNCQTFIFGKMYFSVIETQVVYTIIVLEW